MPSTPPRTAGAARGPVPRQADHRLVSEAAWVDCRGGPAVSVVLARPGERDGLEGRRRAESAGIGPAAWRRADRLRWQGRSSGTLDGQRSWPRRDGDIDQRRDPFRDRDGIVVSVVLPDLPGLLGRATEATPASMTRSRRAAERPLQARRRCTTRILRRVPAVSIAGDRAARRLAWPRSSPAARSAFRIARRSSVRGPRWRPREDGVRDRAPERTRRRAFARGETAFSSPSRSAP